MSIIQVSKRGTYRRRSSEPTYLQSLWKNVKCKQKDWLKCKNADSKKIKFGDYKSAHKCFDKAVRQAKRAFQHQKVNALDAMINKDSGNFWKEIGKIGSEEENRCQQIPMEVITGDGEITEDIDRVMSKWKNDFSCLFTDNGSGFDDNFLSHISKQLKGLESNSQDIDSRGNDLNLPIELNEVTAAVKRAKLNKAAGMDGIVAEVVKNKVSVQFLHALFSFCFKHGISPMVWQKGIIQPILKTGMDEREPLSYRGITLLSVICKIYCDIIRERLTNFLEKECIIKEEQNGFRKKRSCLDHLYSLYSIIENRKLCRKDTFVCFIDARKAFDRVNRILLWYKLRSIGVHGNLYNSIKALYQDTKCTVNVNGKHTELFDVESGVKQGCLLSPVLFNVFINDLVDSVRLCNRGIQVLDTNIDMLMYADDIVVLADNENDLQLMLDNICSWAHKWRIEFNTSKTQVVHFRRKVQAKTSVIFHCNEQKLDIVDSYKYLGLWFDEFLSPQKGTKMLAQSATRALGVVISKFKMIGGSLFMTYKKLYDAMILPILQYASSIWPGFR